MKASDISRWEHRGGNVGRFAAGAAADPAQPLTLKQAVERALNNYPSIRVSQEQINAAAAGIQLARTAYLPRIDALAQANRATRNNVFGLLLPQSVIPSMSGPVIGTNNLGTAWGSAIGVLVSWEPFDFGLRQRQRGRCRRRARASPKPRLQRTRFDVAVATADAYLTLAAAQETVRAAQAGVDRADVIVAHHPRAGECRTASRRRRVARRSRTGRRANATDSGAAGRRDGARRPSRSSPASSRRKSRSPRPLCCNCRRAQPAEPLNAAANPIAVEQNAVDRAGAGAAPGAGTFLLPALLFARRRRTRAAPAPKPTARCWAA